MSERCEDGRHQKVYANFTLTSDPPYHPWICQRCGAEGADRGTSSPRNLYEEERRKFATPNTEADGSPLTSEGD